MKCALYRVDTGHPFIADAVLHTNDDGSVRFALPNGTGWAGQEPNVYGLRHPDQPADQVPGAYQRATLDGHTVTFVTRPQDPPMGYFFVQGKAF
jgi:hypothetical protein